MPEVKEAAVHVEILPSEAIDSKRNILEMELHLLDVLRNLLSLKELIKFEIALKKETRTKMREMSHTIKQVLDILPVEEVLPKKEEEEIRKAIEFGKEKEEEMLPRGKRARLDAELQDIKRKLEKLI